VVRTSSGLLPSGYEQWTISGSSRFDKSVASKKHTDHELRELLGDSRLKYREAVECMVQIERGLLGLRALMQLVMAICKKQRQKALYGPMRELTKGLRELREDTFKGYTYNANHRRCRAVNVKEHRLRT